MVSKKSIMKAVRESNQWELNNPNATVGQRMRQAGKSMMNLFEVKATLATLPSVFVSIPKAKADEWQRRLQNKK